MDRVAAVQQSYLDRVGALPEGWPVPDPLAEQGWRIEELRVRLNDSSA